MKENLIKVLNSAGKTVEKYDSSENSTVLVLPYGGRILGLFPSGSEENFYWTNPVLENAETARTFYESNGWHNSGGDRTWLSPEISFFFPDFPNVDNYIQPRQLDPGHYKVVHSDDKIKLINQLEIKSYRSKDVLELRITKSIGPATNPLHHESGFKRLNNLEYAGYTLSVTLEMLGDIANNRDKVGLWNLVQMPHGGDLLVPTYVKTDPVIYFGDVPKDDMIVSENLIRYKMRAEGGQKIGVRAVATPGRVGYLYRSAKNWAIIIRNFFVNPSGEYIDATWNDPECMGCSTQACNVNVELSTFSELEYHAPAIGGETGKMSCEDATQVWAFRGPLEDITSVARLLLTPGI